MNIADENLPLQRILHWEQARAHHVYLTQPMGGAVRDYTWSQTVGEARRVAAWLKAEGVKRGWPERACIGILSKNCAHWIMCDFAIWMAGYVSVPLYPTLTAQSVRQILEHSEAKALFVGKLDDWPAMKSGVPDDVLCFSCPLSPPNDFAKWDDIIKTAPLAPVPLRDGDDLATIVYTSGTTGMPKGVMHKFKTFALVAEVGGEIWHATPDDRVLSHLPLAHVAERLGVESASLAYGFRVFFAESLETFARDLRTARPTKFGTVPRLWAKFQQGVFSKMPQRRLDRLLKIPLVRGIVRKKILDGLGMDQVQSSYVGAAPMPPAMLEWYRRLGLNISEVYGMTENFAISHGTRPGQGRIGYVGTPYDEVECKLSEIGEVLVKSPGNMIGYYKEPEKTREALSEDGWLKTGDLGAFDEQGRLRITGRAKELFKTSKGKYVAPAPIENKLSAGTGIDAVCVAGANYGQPCALAMLSPDAAKLDRATLTRSLGEHLAAVNATLDPHEQLDFLALVKDPWNIENGFITPTL
ncbi:MAG: AMP-binding protein, partial [Stenotrophobium sp.]